jgi:hypothetical protein
MSQMSTAACTGTPGCMTVDCSGHAARTWSAQQIKPCPYICLPCVAAARPDAGAHEAAMPGASAPGAWTHTSTTMGTYTLGVAGAAWSMARHTPYVRMVQTGMWQLYVSRSWSCLVLCCGSACTVCCCWLPALGSAAVCVGACIMFSSQQHVCT